MKLNIAVIFGGRSVEHEISVISAHQCINAINKDKYRVTPLYISKQGDWYTGKALLDLKNYRDYGKLFAQTEKIIVNQNAGAVNFYKEPRGIFTRSKPINIDVAFPVTHGTYGEDGALQGLFEIMNIPYVGCDVLASAVTMDKITSKILLQASGIKVLDYFWFYSERWISNKDAVMADIKNRFNYPLIVKPGNLGSSIGVTAVTNGAELEDAIDLVVNLSQRIMVEPQVTNLKEVNCAVLGDHDFAQVSICEEPMRVDKILSYRDKYCNGGKGKFGSKSGGVTSGGMKDAGRKIPAEIPDEMATKIQTIAKKAFIDLNCSGVVRIDFLIDRNTDEIYLCELNTIPGSLSFFLWEPLGIDFNVLTERLIEIALKRHRESNNLIVSYSENILKNMG